MENDNIGNYTNTIFRSILVGIKSNVLFYFSIFMTWISSEMLLILFVSGLLNGFFDGIIVSIKNATKYKILSSIIGFIFSIFLFILSLYINLPDILADYFIYGEGGGGLGAGGWFGFNLCLLIYLGITLFVSFPITMLLFSNDQNKK